MSNFTWDGSCFFFSLSRFLRRQKETRENLIQTEVDRRVKDIVEARVREELERRKDEIENEVKRRVDVLKRTMEKQMLAEIEKRNTEEIRRLIAREVRKEFSMIEFDVVRSRKTNEKNVKISNELSWKTNENYSKQKNDL